MREVAVPCRGPWTFAQGLRSKRPRGVRRGRAVLACAAAQIVVALGSDWGRDDLQLAVVRRELEHGLFERSRLEGLRAPDRRLAWRGSPAGLCRAAQIVRADRGDDVDAARDLLGSLEDARESRRSRRTSRGDGRALAGRRMDRTRGRLSAIAASSSRVRSEADARVAPARGGGSCRAGRRSDVFRSARTRGISNPQASMTARKLSMLGETSPCSQRAISDLAMPLRSASSSWVRPARVLASRIGSAPRTT